jgi:NADPH:quinone reductase-like Zn-dependent oxidoreductase
MSQTQQKALLLQSKQGSFVVSTVPKPLPTPPGELFVKILATGLNPIDFKVQEFGVFVPDDKYPVILGVDIAGDVEEIGDGVTGFKKGDRVFFNGIFSNEYTGYQQYTRVPAEIAYKVCAISFTESSEIFANEAQIPAKLSYSEAATIALGFNTAAIGLYANDPIGLALNPTFSSDVKEFQSKAVLVIGGSSSIGQYGQSFYRC